MFFFFLVIQSICDVGVVLSSCRYYSFRKGDLFFITTLWVFLNLWVGKKFFICFGVFSDQVFGGGCICYFVFVFFNLGYYGSVCLWICYCDYGILVFFLGFKWLMLLLVVILFPLFGELHHFLFLSYCSGCCLWIHFLCHWWLRLLEVSDWWQSRTEHSFKKLKDVE